MIKVNVPKSQPIPNPPQQAIADVDDGLGAGFDDNEVMNTDNSDDLGHDNGEFDGGDENDEPMSDDTTKEIQSTAGKLAQQIRDAGGIDDNLKKQVKGTVDSALKENKSVNINNMIDEIIEELVPTHKKRRDFDLKNMFKTRLK